MIVQLNHYYHAFVGCFGPEAGSKSISWIITDGSCSKASHVVDSVSLPLDWNDFPSCAFEYPGINLGRGLYFARTGVVGLGHTDMETLGWPRFPCASPGMATICFTFGLRALNWFFLIGP
jgi:hypothetical protein